MQTGANNTDTGKVIKFTWENYETSDITEALCSAVLCIPENTDACVLLLFIPELGASKRLDARNIRGRQG